MQFIHLEGNSNQSDLNLPENRALLQTAMDGLNSIIEANPDNWAAKWMLGKSLQALSLHEEAYVLFLKAHRSNLTNQTILRELAFECLCTKRYSQAVYYCNSAIEFDIDDYSLWPNMAVALLFDGKLKEARKWIDKSVGKIPDTSTMRVAEWISEIEVGKCEIPTDFLAHNYGKPPETNT